MNNSFLILVRGLGGSGKTTLSTNLSKRLKIPVLNRDDIKPAIRSVLANENIVVDTSYSIMNSLAKVQLKNGVSVILDANARFKSMEKYYFELCDKYDSELIVITCICSDHAVWEERVVRRGNTHPHSFSETRDMYFEKFSSKTQIEIDTSLSTEAGTLNNCIVNLKNLGLSI